MTLGIRFASLYERESMTSFEEWDSFYLIVGGAAGALIGLEFVVMTLIAGRPRLASPEINATFATPTIVYFAAALLLSAVMRAPWHTMLPAALLCGAIGVSGAIYLLSVLRRMRRQSNYDVKPDDWVFYAGLPLAAHVTLVVAAFIASPTSLFAIAAATVALLFTGIHNSWDSVSYLVTYQQEGELDTAARADPSSSL